MWPFTSSFSLFSLLNPFTYLPTTPATPYDLCRTPRHRRQRLRLPGAGTKRRRSPSPPSRAVRTRHDPGAILTTLHGIENDIDPEHPYDEMAERIHGSLSPDSARLEYEHSAWNDDTDVVTPTADNDGVDLLRDDEDYAAARPPLRTHPDPFASLTKGLPPGPRNSAARDRHDTLLAARAKVTAENWNDHDVAIYVHLQLRGLEPLLPQSMSADFPQLGNGLFTESRYDQGGPMLAPMSHWYGDEAVGSVARASRALEPLLDVGAMVRDLRRFAGNGVRPPGDYVKGVAEGYLAWALRDAGVDPTMEEYLPNLVVEAFRYRVNANFNEQEEWLARKMEGLRGLWVERLGVEEGGKMPIYGIVCVGAKVALLSLKEPGVGGAGWVAEGGDDAEEEEDPEPFDWKTRLRILEVYDFEAKGRSQDVWSALSVAMLIVHARNIMTEALAREAEEEQDSDLDGNDDDEDGGDQTPKDLFPGDLDRIDEGINEALDSPNAPGVDGRVNKPPRAREVARARANKKTAKRANKEAAANRAVDTKDRNSDEEDEGNDWDDEALRSDDEAAGGLDSDKESDNGGAPDDNEDEENGDGDQDEENEDDEDDEDDAEPAKAFHFRKNRG